MSDIDRAMIDRLWALAPNGYMLTFEHSPGHYAHFLRGYHTLCGVWVGEIALGHVPNVGERYDLCPACRAALPAQQMALGL